MKMEPQAPMTKVTNPPSSVRRYRPRLGLGIGVLLALVAASAPAAEPWEKVCAEQAATPEIEQAVPLVPHPGKWRGKAFGDKEKHDVEVVDCGRTIQGMARVSFVKGVVGKGVPLERDEDDGRYRAKFVYTEGRAAVVVTWDLEADSESRMTGQMSIMGRSREATAELLEAKPNPELTTCECDALGSRRDVLAGLLTDSGQDTRPTAQSGATRGWTTDPESCAILSADLDPEFPTQASFETAARASWQGELVHRERCCAVHREGAADADMPASYSEWISAAAEDYASDEIAALTAQVGALDAWLQASCVADQE